MNSISASSNKINSQNKKQTTLKDFQILSRLGQGSFGQVFKVKRIQDNEIYALKKVKINAMPQKDRQNALNQIRILASQKKAFFDQDTLTLNIIMQFAANGDILKRIEKYQNQGKYYPEAQIWTALVHMCYGLKSLHDKKIVHRDLKSANVFITQNGIYKLGDLNVSKVMKGQFARTQIGTPFYTPPEIWKQRPYGNKCDMWSLGCVLYEMAAGRPPFNGRDLQSLCRKILMGKFQRIPYHYSASLSNIITKLLNQVPQLRPSTDQIFQMKEVFDNFKGKIQIPSALALQSKKLIGTLKMKNNNIRSLKNILPKANYDGDQKQILSQSIQIQQQAVEAMKMKLIQQLQEKERKQLIPKPKGSKKSLKQILYGDKLPLADENYLRNKRQPSVLKRIRSLKRIENILPPLNNLPNHNNVEQKQKQKTTDDSQSPIEQKIKIVQKQQKISSQAQKNNDILKYKVPILDIQRKRQMHQNRKERVLSACKLRIQLLSLEKQKQRNNVSVENNNNRQNSYEKNQLNNNNQNKVYQSRSKERQRSKSKNKLFKLPIKYSNNNNNINLILSPVCSKKNLNLNPSVPIRPIHSRKNIENSNINVNQNNIQNGILPPFSKVQQKSQVYNVLKYLPNHDKERKNQINGGIKLNINENNLSNY